MNTLCTWLPLHAPAPSRSDSKLSTWSVDSLSPAPSKMDLVHPGMGRSGQGKTGVNTTAGVPLPARLRRVRAPYDDVTDLPTAQTTKGRKVDVAHVACLRKRNGALQAPGH